MREPSKSPRGQGWTGALAHKFLSLVANQEEEVALADPTDRVPESVPGQYYVDTNCIDCDVCRDTAPDNFTRSDANGYSYVFKQPANEEERALCEEALAACPVEAIGNDG